MVNLSLSPLFSALAFASVLTLAGMTPVRAMPVGTLDKPESAVVQVQYSSPAAASRGERHYIEGRNRRERHYIEAQGRRERHYIEAQGRYHRHRIEAWKRRHRYY